MASRKVVDVETFCRFVEDEVKRLGFPKLLASKIRKDCLRAGRRGKLPAIPGLEGLGVFAQGAKRTRRLPIETAVVVSAARFVRKRFPKIRRLHLVGSRLRRKVGRDIDFVAVVASRQLTRRNVLDLPFGNLNINVFFTLPDEVEPAILEFGLGMDDVRWKRKAKAMGLTLNRYGLWKGSVRVSNKMKEIAAILDLPLKPFLLMSLRNPL
jgi:hypothetical protein